MPLENSSSSFVKSGSESEESSIGISAFAAAIVNPENSNEFVFASIFRSAARFGNTVKTICVSPPISVSVAPPAEISENIESFSEPDI
ncbi:hypothetical protein SDC9_135948 [bioreactor metagenome]|uniref:Uncharacterized protein n=1 Tax=bioreactor metagenome TaxID=1076179 RepID=A0A645DH90_9ZZZZ